MPSKSAIEYLVYALVIVLSIIVLLLIFVSPPDFAANKSVYQGF